MKQIATLVQVISVACLGAFAGAMIMLYTAILSYWKQISPKEFLDWYSSYASGIMDATGPLVMASIAIPIICFFLTFKNKTSRIYWLISFSLSVLIMIITMSYFVDVNSSFAHQSIELNLVKETLITWGNYHILRIALASASAIIGGIGLCKYLQSH